MVAFDTGFPADSLEFCPNPAANDIFVCGTYKLDEDKFSSENQRLAPQRRRGQCLVFQLQLPDAVQENPNEIPYSKIQDFDLPAILDMKWSHTGNASPLLAIADSEGSITLHKLDTDAHRLGQTERIQCTSPDVLCLSLDWSNRLSSKSSVDASLVVSLSDGMVCIIRQLEAALTVTDTWHAHDHEPWVAAWNHWDNNLVYSGGDDLKLKTWDVRCGFEVPICVNSRFDAGVTSIQSHPHIENLLAVGSYNNTVQLFDARKPLLPIAQADVGGGAWRVKWHPSASRRNDLLVASMHDGFKVITFDIDASKGDTSVWSEGRISKRFDEHASLAYGVDWSFAPYDGGKETIIGSCSFYDHTLHLWRG